MGCDQSKDEIRLSNYEDFDDDFYKETEKKAYNLYQKEYFFWVWTLNIEKNIDFLSQAAELWMPFPFDISRNIENTFSAKEKTYCLKSHKRKLIFDFEKKLLRIFNCCKKNLETQNKEKDSIDIDSDGNNNNYANNDLNCGFKSIKGFYAEKLLFDDDYYDSNESFSLKLNRVKVPSRNTDEESNTGNSEKEKQPNVNNQEAEEALEKEEEDPTAKEIEAAIQETNQTEKKEMKPLEKEEKSEKLNLLKCLQDPTDSIVCEEDKKTNTNKQEKEKEIEKEKTAEKNKSKKHQRSKSLEKADRNLNSNLQTASDSAAANKNILLTTVINENEAAEKDIKNNNNHLNIEAEKQIIQEEESFEESFEEYFTLHSEIKLFSEKESYDFFSVYKSIESSDSISSVSCNKAKNFYKSNSNQETNFNLLNNSSSIDNSNGFSERKMNETSASKFSRSYSHSKMSTQKNPCISPQSNSNIIYISDLFSKVHLFGLFDMPLFFHPDFIKYLKLRIPKNIFTLNELKEYLITEITKEAKALVNSRYEKKQSEKPAFGSSSNERQKVKQNANGKEIIGDFLNKNETVYLISTENATDNNNNVLDSHIRPDENPLNKKEKENNKIAFKEEDHKVKESFSCNLTCETKDYQFNFYENAIEEFASYRDQADIYTNFIKQIDKDNICQIILHVYTFKGFINKSVKFMLKEKLTDKSYLIGFLVILMGVMKCDGINNFFGYFYPRNLVFEEPGNKKRFIRLYKEIDCKLVTLVEFIEKLEVEKSKFFDRIKEKYTYLYDKAILEEEKMEYDGKLKHIFNSIEFHSKDFLVTSEILSVTWDQSQVFQQMQNRNLLIIDLDIEIIKNNPSIISFTNLHNYFPNKPEMALIPGCALAYKSISIDPINDLNLIQLEFLGNFFNPYDKIKFSNESVIKFNELHVENQKNKFQINQEKIFEYFSEAVLLNRNLKTLDISDNRLNEVLFSKIAFCLKSNFNLCTLNISNNNLGENSAVYLKEILENNFFLENLIMSNIHFKNEGLKAISHSLLKNKTLKSFDISNNFINFEGAEILKIFLLNNACLEKLNLSENNITNEKGENPLSEALKYNMKLEEVNFSDCDFNEKTVIELFENLKENFSLKKLVLSKNKLNEAAIISLFDMLGNYDYSALKHLEIAFINFSEKACEKISEILKKANCFLNVLDLSSNNISDNSMKLIFEALKYNVSLFEVDFRNNKCGREILFILSNLLLNDVKVKKIFIKGNFKEEEENLVKGFDFLYKMITFKNVEVDITQYLH